MARHGGEVALIDGTLIPTQRRTKKADRRNYSGKHRSHGLRFLALTDGRGHLIWISAARPGRTHDNTAARHDRILRRSCLLRAISLASPVMTPSSTLALGSQAAGAAPGRPRADWLPSRPDLRGPPATAGRNW
ncbi:transposase family protein [Streptomyces syringium]|uniref:transposase family protein n=1 Tax=Streptomyces syringium TaxID=76729 RepID=UPI0036E7121C